MVKGKGKICLTPFIIAAPSDDSCLISMIILLSRPLAAQAAAQLDSPLMSPRPGRSDHTDFEGRQKITIIEK